jgi:predicted Zn-dependent peptidase
MTVGSKKYPREKIRKEFSRTASSIGSGAGYDYSVMSFASTKENFQSSWDVFTDVIINPSFLPSDVELTRERLLTVLRDDEDTPDSFLDSLEQKLIYAKHPYEKNPRGKIQTISKLSATDLKAYHQKMFQTSRLLLIIVGNFSDTGISNLKQLLTNTIGKLPQGNYIKKPTLPINFTQPSIDITEKPLETNYIKGIFAAPNLADPDYYAMKVAITILQQNVYREVRDVRNLSYAPNAEMKNSAANTANIYVTTNEPNRAVVVMLDEIAKLKNEPVAKEELPEISSFFLTQYFVKNETNANQVTELAAFELLGKGWRESGTFLDSIRKVTPADIQRVSQKYMKNLRFVFIGDPNKVDKKVFLQK